MGNSRATVEIVLLCVVAVVLVGTGIAMVVGFANTSAANEATAAPERTVTAPLPAPAEASPVADPPSSPAAGTITQDEGTKREADSPPEEGPSERQTLIEKCYKTRLDAVHMQMVNAGFSGTVGELRDRIEEEAGAALREHLNTLPDHELVLYLAEQRRQLAEASKVGRK